MEILNYPNDILTKQCVAVEKVTPELVDTAKEMYTIMRRNNGIGLAAPQVGLSIRLIVLEDNGKPLIMFNPQILKQSKETEYGNEGCLSFPGVFRNLKRAKEVTVKYRDEHNKMKYLVLNGIQARCVLHETDHIQGRLYTYYEEKN